MPSAGDPNAGASTMASAAAPDAYGSTHHQRPRTMRRWIHGIHSATSNSVCTKMKLATEVARWLCCAPARCSVVSRLGDVFVSARPVSGMPIIGREGFTPR